MIVIVIAYVVRYGIPVAIVIQKDAEIPVCITGIVVNVIHIATGTDIDSNVAIVIAGVIAYPV